MKKQTLIKYFLLIFTVCIVFAGNNNSFALEDVANYSELYKQYLELSDEEKEKVDVIPEKYSTSFKQYYNTNAYKKALRNTSVLPSRYNLAEHYNIKVENQGQEGNCWTFASLETLETYLQIHGYGTFDFSENHLNYIESNMFSETEVTRSINTAGSFNELRDYLNKKLGPVSEEDYPYFEDETTSESKRYKQDELDSLLNITPLAYVGDYVSFPSVNKSDKDDNLSKEELTEYRNNIKKHIIENGAIYTVITAPTYYNDEFYNPSTYAAYFPNTTDYRFSKHSHAVAIIGWDDDFSKDNFVEANKPQNDGAYIALNSWGSSFGDNGIYYISYDDAYVEMDLKGIKEAVTDPSDLVSTTTFSISDKNLYNALKDVLGRKIINSDDNTQSITMLNGIINEIQYLDLIDYNISDLSGIENFTNLTTLNVSNNNISSITPLLSLHQLDTINLSHNQLNTIPEELSNSALSSLFLGYNPITDFSGIANIKSVSKLDLEGTNIKANDLEYLKNKKIISLNLSNTKIKDYSALKALIEEQDSNDYLNTSLQQLNISYNNNIDYSTIPNVCYLNLSNTSVDENTFKQIPDISKLDALDISYTKIKDLNVLSGIPLRAVYISGNKDLKNIDKLKYTGLIIYENAGLKDVSIFKDFYASQINLSNNEIEDCDSLLENEYLRIIDLSDNKLTTIPYKDGSIITANGNKIKPIVYNSENIDSLKNQKYEETLIVDPNNENTFTDIITNLSDFDNNGIKYAITNASFDLENQKFTIDDYDKDVIISIKNGIFEGSTITYKLEKKVSNLIYIAVDRDNLRTRYVEGEEIDLSNLKVYAYYDTNSKSEITDYSISGLDNLHVGLNTITVEKDIYKDFIDITILPNSDIITLTFKSKDIYNATLKKIKQIEKEMQEYAYLYNLIDVLINNNNSENTIQILKNDLDSINYLEIESDELTSIEDIKQLKGLTGISINGKKLEDLSPLLYIKDILDQRDDLMSSEKLLGIEIKNNDVLTKIDYDIFRMLVLENTKITNLNNLTKIGSIIYKGNEMPNLDDIIDNLYMMSIEVNSSFEQLEKDENNNIILPNLLKLLKNKGLKIEVNLYDQIRDTQYLNPYNKIPIELIDDGEKLLINYNDIKNIDYEGNKQFVQINIIDESGIYVKFDFIYKLSNIIINEPEESSSESETPSDINEKPSTNTDDNIIVKELEENKNSDGLEEEREENNLNSANPTTGDNITFWINLLFIFFVGAVATIYCK